jgi:Flp pilus assembly protein TadD
VPLVLCGVPLIVLAFVTRGIPIMNKGMPARQLDEVTLAPEEMKAVQGLLNLGSKAVREQHIEESIDASIMALSLQPRSVIGWNNLGFALAVRGRNKAAEAALVKATKLDPSFALARNNLAWVKRKIAESR